MKVASVIIMEDIHHPDIPSHIILLTNLSFYFLQYVYFGPCSEGSMVPCGLSKRTAKPCLHSEILNFSPLAILYCAWPPLLFFLKDCHEGIQKRFKHFQSKHNKSMFVLGGTVL